MTFSRVICVKHDCKRRELVHVINKRKKLKTKRGGTVQKPNKDVIQVPFSPFYGTSKEYNLKPTLNNK